MPIKIDYKKCNACKICYDECPGDVIGWDEEKDIPFVKYIDECWYCGNCEIHCPRHAIDIQLPLRVF